MSGGGSDVMSYRDLSLPHDAVCALPVLFVLLGLIVTLLVAEQPQGLRALQFNLKLLQGKKHTKIVSGSLFLCQNWCNNVENLTSTTLT